MDNEKNCGPRHHDKNCGPGYMHGCMPFNPRDVAKMRRMAHQFMGNFMGNYIHHNIEDLENEYLITVPLPGRTKDDVTVSLINKHLNIKANKPKVPEHEKLKQEPENQGFPFMFKGFTFVEVNMDVPLPTDADENKISSRMTNGLLRVIIGKKPAKPIDITDEPNN
jgi:HSP20 family molecular chaperone IbpA